MADNKRKDMPQPKDAPKIVGKEDSLGAWARCPEKGCPFVGHGINKPRAIREVREHGTQYHAWRP